MKTKKPNQTTLVIRKLDSILEYLKAMHADLKGLNLIKEKTDVKEH